MPGNELDIEEAACAEVSKRFGIVSLKLNVQSNTGWPDRMFLIPGGRPFYIEFKQPGEEPDPRQRLIHAQLKYLQYEVETHDTVQGAVHAVEKRLAAAVKAGWAHSEGAAQTAKMEAARVPEKGNEVHVRAWRGRTLPRPGTGQD